MAANNGVQPVEKRLQLSTDAHILPGFEDSGKTPSLDMKEFSVENVWDTH